MKPPKHVWADYDPSAPRGDKWAFYNTRGEQRTVRPDLAPIRLQVGEPDYRDKAGRTLQPLVFEKGAVRFKSNAIVDFLLEKGGFDMNDLARMNFSHEDRAQFAQLIGYSVCGFGDLPYVSGECINAADQAADEFRVKKGAA